MWRGLTAVGEPLLSTPAFAMRASLALPAAALRIHAGSSHASKPPLWQVHFSSNAVVGMHVNIDNALEPVSGPDPAAATQTGVARDGPPAPASLFLGLLISALLHGVFIGFGGIAPQRAGTPGKVAINLSFRPAAPVSTQAVPVEAATVPVEAATVPAATIPKPRGRASAAVPVLRPAPTRFESDSSALQRAPRDDVKLDLARFDPVLYLPPSEVQRVALPVNQELFDFLPLTGFESGLWMVRLFIDEQGWVNEVEFVESRGSERNADELKAILLANRFMPGLRDDAPIKSQKMIEVSFEPGPEPRLSIPVLIPSVAGR